MPRTKSPKSKSPKSTLHSSRLKNFQVSQNSDRLINLVNTINTKRKDISKMHNNLPAKLMELNISGQPTNQSSKNKIKGKSQVYAKSISSTFSSVMHNGHTHSQGKRIINESNKPFLQVEEMHDGSTQHYMIPKNSIPYKPNKFAKTLVHSSKSKYSKHTKKHSPKK